MSTDHTEEIIALSQPAGEYHGIRPTDHTGDSDGLISNIDLKVYDETLFSLF